MYVCDYLCLCVCTHTCACVPTERIKQLKNLGVCRIKKLNNLAETRTAVFFLILNNLISKSRSIWSRISTIKF